MVKIIYALIGIGILAGLYLTFANQSEAPATNDTIIDTQETNETSDTETNTTDNTESDDATLDAEADVSVDAEAELGGNDVGMEMPTPDQDESETTTREFTVDSFNYGYSMEEIRVNEGDTVTINLTNSEGFHDWVVDEFGAATEQIQAGSETSVTFVASEAGTYEYYCSVGSHRAQGMVGTLIVE